MELNLNNLLLQRQGRILKNKSIIIIIIIIYQKLPEPLVREFINFINESNAPRTVNGGFSKEDTAYMLLYYMLFSEEVNTKNFKEKLGMPGSQWAGALEKFLGSVEEFNKIHIVCGRLSERRIAACTMSTNNQHCTGILDGVHIKVLYLKASDQFLGGNYISYKFQKPALNIQVVVNGFTQAI
jgi:hypothetical protein